MPFDWTITVVGAVLCILYGWCLHSSARNQTIWIVKIGPLIVIIGTVTLAGMAMSGHADVAEDVGTVPEYSIVVAPERLVAEAVSEDMIRSRDVFSSSLQLTNEVGARPSTDHVVYANAYGELSWITKDEYKVILRKGRKGSD